MVYLAVAVSLGLFARSLKWFRAVETAVTAFPFARSAMAALFDATLSDDDKERAAQAACARLLIHATEIIARFALSAAVPLVLLELLIAARLLSSAPLAQVLESWEFMGASAIVVGATLLWRQ